MRTMRSLKKRIRWVVFGLAAIAVIDQLSRPSEERTWEGEVLGLVPYDFRMPTMDRVRQRWWNPDDQRLFVPQVFGVGWTINLARAFALVRRDERPALDAG
jgi:uncharacterized protein DUF5808